MTNMNRREGDDSGFSELDAGTRMISVVDFRRFEKKLDLLSDAIGKLVLVEERQSNQNMSIIELRKDIEANRLAIDKTDKLLQQWINRGIGVWGLAITIFSLVEIFLRR